MNFFLMNCSAFVSLPYSIESRLGTSLEVNKETVCSSCIPEEFSEPLFKKKEFDEAKYSSFNDSFNDDVL